MDKKEQPFIKRIFKKKRTWVILALVLIFACFFIFRTKDNSKNTTTDIASYKDLKQTVLATGQVTSKTDLNLSFNANGILKSIKVNVGDQVKKGTVLATLDQGQALASLTQARGALAAANARYKRTIEGASSEEVTIAQIALDNAKRDFDNVATQQKTLVSNAYNNLLNSYPQAVPEGGQSDYTAPTISGNYNLGKEGSIKVNTYATGSGLSYSVSGIASGTGTASVATSQPLGNSGLYITFPSLSGSNVSSWVITIPNTKASNYLTNYNAYQVALKTQDSALSQAQSLIDQRTAELALKKASARQSDLDLAKADIVTAEGQLQAASSIYENTVLRAPADGTITSIDIKVGELAQALKGVMVLQDTNNLYIEANINEANIANIKVWMPVDINFDAFGTEKIFQGHILDIDPSSTIVSGVVNYKIHAILDTQVKDLRPGMTANMTINVAAKNHVISIPARAILTDATGKKTIRIVTNKKTKAFKEVPVVTGFDADGGLVEVASGLNEGDEFVVLIKQ
jgi:RND family efflux transporter MFP subunit